MTSQNSDTPRWRQWWSRPAGAREVVYLAMPLVISTSSWTIMHFIDRVFLAWYSPQALAAALPSAMVYFMTICFFLGLAMYVNPFVAQYQGARRPERIGPAVWQGIWIACLSLPLVIAIWPFTQSIFDAIGHSSEIRPLEVAYFKIHCVAALPSVVAEAISCFFTGRGRTRVVMLVEMMAAGINIVLDYVLIFGYLGAPELGIEGAAWATVVAQWIKLGVYGLLFLTPAHEVLYRVRSGWRPDPPLLGRLMWYGAPSGGQWLVEVGAFTLFVLLLGRLGELELAASSLAFNINTFAFVPMFGLGMAVTTLVGQRLGENRADLARRATYSAVSLAMVYMAVIGTAYAAIPDAFTAAHGANADPREFAAVRALTAILLRFVAAYCALDTINVIFAGALRGAGDTRFIILASLIIPGLGVLATYVATEHLNFRIYAAWTIVTAWISLLGLAMFARFRQGKWQSMRVIETTLLPELETPVEQGDASAAERDPTSRIGIEAELPASVPVD